MNLMNEELKRWFFEKYGKIPSTAVRDILELDKEKLELMRKIDSLERLVSKQRKSLY